MPSVLKVQPPNQTHLLPPMLVTWIVCCQNTRGFLSTRMRDLRVGVGNHGKIISKATFFVFQTPAHLTLCTKSQLATNKECILNRYHNCSSERKVLFTLIKHDSYSCCCCSTRECTQVGAKNHLLFSKDVARNK